MKFCSKCGNQLVDEAVVCPKCGCAVDGASIKVTSPQGQPATQGPSATQEQPTPHESTMSTLAKVFMIIGTVVGGLSCIPLAWCLPMTISYCNKLKRGEPVSTAFKVCSLLFVNLLAGIFMLCDNDNP